MQGEDTVEVTKLEHPSHPRLRDDQLQITVEQSHSLERADEHTQAERVDEIDP